MITWRARHAAFVRERAEALRLDGYLTYVEDQNELKMRGRTAVLTGTPDLVAVKGESVLVVDCKTGAEHGFHRMQVLLYMLMLPRLHRACSGKVVSGEVRYIDKVYPIDPSEVTADLQDFVWNAVRLVARSEASSVITRS